ncbi:DNA repair protein RecN [Fervidibacillus halotolerans]|uniref:DNA repair protein RecN n=1 Tax=Fervidibacillus halotolerans TaxID=2980027 RepID=A0A9E8RW65_9BACI|nr:DNA repair protein RecN [Fervidibacillus halotolerans]WAA11415.1 DNA repair protein RecN [Fervidibacillus halotolerans]
MLAELSIKNFAIIDELTVSFQKGFTVLTGETGAGKSIIIDAIHLLVGGRGSVDFVRHGTTKAEIEGLFLIEDDHPAIWKLREIGIDVEEGMVVLKRDIHVSGKSVCRINGKLVTISSLRELGSTLVDIHGQHEHQELMDRTSHLRLLDEFGGDEVKKTLKEYALIFREYEKLKKELQKLTENEQQMAQKLDLLSFQHQEILGANLQIGEDDTLLKEKKKLMNYEQLYNAIQMGYDALQGEQKGLDWLGLAMNHLEDAAQIDEQFKSLYDLVSNFYYQLEDVTGELRQYLDQFEFDPEKINQVEERLSEIHQLKRKYGKSIEEILEYAAKIEEEIELITNRESYIEKMTSKLRSVEKDLLVEGNHLSNLRKRMAKQLTKAIQKELKDLYMEKTEFEVHFDTGSDFKPDGIDEVEFLISTNPGEPKKPLAKIASGGELSRIMLALKTIFSTHQGVTSIIFDEVDTGVSGRVAQSIGEKIFHISIGSQVLSITHLPQVASMGDHHYFITKEMKGDRTVTSIRTLNEEERTTEIARMISGSSITEATITHAKEMLDIARKKKSNSVPKAEK